ncbi:MAG: YtxH domain-containing protein [Candidatus Abawacabacteria bacterium]|nr:YtxH domain-containing protein [Candidatus Abawacabacteria bacterium]
MSDQECKHCSGAGKKVFGAAFAAAIGAVAGLLFAPKPGKQLRKDLAKQANSLKKNMQKTSAEMQEVVHSTFEGVSTKLEQHYAELKAQVLAAVEQLDGKVKLTQKKYNSIVQDVVAMYTKGKKLAESSVKELVARLQEEWENLKN